MNLAVWCVAAAALFATGCGGSSPEDDARAAVEEYFEALRDEDVETVCRKTFPSTLLPESVAERLRVDAQGGESTADWPALERECRKEFGPPAAAPPRR